MPELGICCRSFQTHPVNQGPNHTVTEGSEQGWDVSEYSSPKEKVSVWVLGVVPLRQ